MITTLLNNGADPDALDEEHRAPLLYLGQLGNMQVSKQLQKNLFTVILFL